MCVNFFYTLVRSGAAAAVIVLSLLFLEILILKIKPNQKRMWINKRIASKNETKTILDVFARHIHVTSEDNTFYS